VHRCGFAGHGRASETSFLRGCQSQQVQGSTHAYVKLKHASQCVHMRGSLGHVGASETTFLRGCQSQQVQSSTYASVKLEHASHCVHRCGSLGHVCASETTFFKGCQIEKIQGSISTGKTRQIQNLFSVLVLREHASHYILRTGVGLRDMCVRHLLARFSELRASGEVGRLAVAYPVLLRAGLLAVLHDRIVAAQPLARR
jgi:hypothetical protein